MRSSCGPEIKPSSRFSDCGCYRPLRADTAGVNHVGSLHNSSFLAPLFKAAPSPTDQ